MIDHTSLSVSDFTSSINFYDASLSILGYERIVNVDTPEGLVAGYGQNSKPSFWIASFGNEQEHIAQARGVHVAFTAPNAPTVDTWYKKCLEFGGRCNGKPGPRAEYHPGYYGAFIIDPSGWRIEACFHSYQQ